MALLGQMSAAMAHDIRNPLGIIRASAERLKKRYGGEGDATFDYIPEEVDRLDRVVSSYLSMGATRPGVSVPVDVAEVVCGVLKDVEHETVRSGIAVETELAGLPAVNANPVELRQVFLNLVLNAVQAQPQGGAIRIAGRCDKDWLVVEVSDKGPGIRSEDMARVFEPFYTTKEKGSGLGLFSVKRIVEAHRGRVTIEAASGSGTTVKTWLPVEKGKGSR
jgi:two-component system sensor histidine kinase HydH